MGHLNFRAVNRLLVLLMLGAVQTAGAQTLVESSAEARFQLDLQVPQAALMRRVPEGWATNVRTEGAAKDANLRVIFIERKSVNGPDGAPVGDGSNVLVYLTVPVKDPSGASAQLVIGGITEDPSDAPGPFGVYLPATVHTLKRTTSNESGATIETQDWAFEAATGEYLKMNITFERGIRNSRPAGDTRFHSAKNPAYVEISRQQQMLDILRNVTTTPADRVHNFSFEAGGGSYADLFDGTEKLLSWDNIVWLNREIYLP